MAPFPLHSLCALFFTIGVPAALVAQMTPTYTLSIPMRDGKTLAADVYVPAACSSCPTILIQTPYNKNLFRFGLPLGTQQNLQASPYSWVVVDWRGFYGSAAAAVAQPNRGADGYDVIDWIADQPWSNGKVGTWGPSALGVIQYQTAKEQHPNHSCAVPVVAHPQSSYDSYFYGGVLEKSRLQTLDALGYGLSPLVLANPYYNLLWQIAETGSWYPASIRIPTLQIGGWYDHNVDKMIDWYQATRSASDLAVRDKQWLLIGPWVHGGTGIANVGSATQGELNYANAAFKNDSMARAFLAHYLLGSNNNWESTPKITYYELGKNSWNTSNSASIEATESDLLFLNEGQGLSAQPGSGFTAFDCDPADPSPTIGGPTLSLGLDQGPYNQTALESRSDVLFFNTGALSGDVTVSGRVKLQLYVQCDQPDADIAVRLADIYPDGRSMLINDGIRRLRLRNGYAKADESFLSPGQVYPVEITLPFVHYTWRTGHALKIYLSGNSSTRWDVNLQNGGAMYMPGDTNLANIRIHHSAQYPGRIILPGKNLVLPTASHLPETPLAIFPNPVSGALLIQSKLRPEVYEILDIQGRMQASGVLEGEKIDVSGLEAGIYVLRLRADRWVVSKRFVKK